MDDRGLTEVLRARGLRSAPTPKRQQPKLIERSRVHQMLTNPYCIGMVGFSGQEYEGRHQAIVSRQTFEQVQTVMRSHRFGEKWRINNHYLKSTIYRAGCGSRLCFQRARGMAVPSTISSASGAIRSAPTADFPISR